MLPGELAALARLVSDKALQERRATVLRTAIESYVAGYALPLSARSMALGRKALIGVFGRGKRLSDGLRARFDQFNATERALRTARAQRAAGTAATLSLIRLVTTLVMLLALVGLLVYAWRSVIVPLRRAIEGCARVARGERGELLEASGRTELSDLGRAFNSMVVQLARGEDELRSSERRHREIVEASIDAFIALDREGVITRWNAAAEALFGWTAEQAIGQRAAETIVPAGLGARLEGLALGGEGSVAAERLQVSARRRDKTEVSVEMLISRSGQKDGGFHAFVHDITERNRARRVLEDERRQLDDAQAIAHVGSWWWEPASDRTEWSAEMFRIFQRDQALGPAVSEDFFAYLHPEDRDRIAAGYGDAFGADEDFDLRYRIVVGNGEVRFLHGIGHREGEGRYVGTVQDVTTVRLAQESLREAEQRFRGAFEEAPIGMALLDLEGRFTKVNDSLCQILGYPCGRLEGMRVAVAHPSRRRWL